MNKKQKDKTMKTAEHLITEFHERVKDYEWACYYSKMVETASRELDKSRDDLLELFKSLL